MSNNVHELLLIFLALHPYGMWAIRKYHVHQHKRIEAIENCMAALSLVEIKLPTHRQLLQVKKFVPFTHAFKIIAELMDVPNKVRIAIWRCYVRNDAVQSMSTTQLVDASGLLPLLGNADKVHRAVLSNLLDRLYEVGAGSMPGSTPGSMPQRILQHLLPPSISCLDTRYLMFFNRLERIMTPDGEEYETAVEYLVTRCSQYFIMAKKTKAKVSLSVSCQTFCEIHLNIAMKKYKILVCSPRKDLCSP